MNVNNNLIVQFDMDGTLFDYEWEVRKALFEMKSPGEESPLEMDFNIWDDNLPWMKERIKLIKMRPGFWKNLPPYQWGWDIYRMTRHLNYQTHILTKGPSGLPHAWAEKVECIRMNFERENPNVVIHITEDKGIHYGRVLVDDYPEYILRWLEHRKRGLVIMPAQTYNRDFKHDNVIRYDGQNKDEVYAALKAASLRKPGEHWRDYLEKKV